ncbi:uncharacterized protein LOC132617940 [Lycium barbarum]|uniref:uncharacterized protein LOC132610267 n=1 Tax=Lycium barbarum TaxID=112863 RepID=UPI00293E8006|nr:uncharacterized protein LOC132610267 [Lycium barbarum]XP_060180562.1 uncharacterized protein LOC132610267 [Lycium barbarum]XP_060180563.1 uncharacterized protein LOC132610267 [Lycium barbarum]XP_060180564.1 uncharacterized protein LOC132610267 [Lycium barbarum]XP_060188988.1 uncharacterized protein LOC132617940 [Lycium barbarum]XP_060188989.1 uncharacterized protein LOC132617940 [Lycium barbarum]XP_060188990.1 uncharacterized protein LOC132617940 [Lycium barbarum]XP_060188991.1 uncharacte
MKCLEGLLAFWLTDFGLPNIGLLNSTNDQSGPATEDIVLPDVGSQQDPDLSDKSQQSVVGTLTILLRKFFLELSTDMEDDLSLHFLVHLNGEIGLLWAYNRAAIKFRGLDADINFNVNDYHDDLKSQLRRPIHWCDC